MVPEHENPFARHDRDVRQSFATGDPGDVKRSYRLFGDYLREAFAGSDAPVLSYAETAPVVAAAVPTGASPVLDAGCGPNPAAGLGVARRGSTVVALDIGLGTVELARATAARAGIALVGVVGDVERLPFRTGSFAAVICDDTIEHLPDDRAGVRELGRVLRAGGSAVVATPNRRGLHVLERRARDLRHHRLLPASHYYAAASHLREYTPGGLRRLLAGSFRDQRLVSVGFLGHRPIDMVASALVRARPFRRLSKVVVVVATRADPSADAARVVRSARAATRSERPRIAVAVSTRNRAHLVTRLLACLEAQDLPAGSFEVVLVDDSSEDTTFDAMAEAVATTDLDLTAVRLSAARGPAAGRNAAWRSAEAQVVAFTDDDCQPEPGWLRAGLAALEQPAVVAGRTVPDPVQEDRRGPFSRTMSVSDVGLVATCNAFYLRRDLQAVDGFDEGYATPGGEDTDLAWRLADRGRALLYAPDAVVRHDISPSDVARRGPHRMAVAPHPPRRRRPPRTSPRGGVAALVLEAVARVDDRGSRRSDPQCVVAACALRGPPVAASPPRRRAGRGRAGGAPPHAAGRVRRRRHRGRRVRRGSIRHRTLLL